MSDHPLDISGILKSSPNDGHAQEKEHYPDSSSASDTSQSTSRIEGKYWSQLNQESRRMLTSRIWKGIDFNPMLAELDDLSRITEKWLKWAVPTYVNGIKEGPIKEWIHGVNREKDFHYVLVGEHLRHLKDIRDKRKVEQTSSQDPVEPLSSDNSDATQVTEAPSDTDGDPRELSASIETLDGHIRWFKQYLKERES
jgi:hypothetical protein